MSDLYENFQKFFQIVVVDSQKLLEESYRIRYQVLCVEKRLPGFDASLYQDQQEWDDYDAHSSHILLQYKPTGDFIGTVRLIKQDPLQPEKLLPIELHTEIDRTICDLARYPREQLAEISRCLVIAKFDRRKNERRNVEQEEGGEKSETSRDRRTADRRSKLSMAVLLMAGVVRMSIQHNINNLLCVMDPILNRLLSFYGLNFKSIGPMSYYHGYRKPYFLNVSELLDKLHKDYYEIWEIITERGRYVNNSEKVKQEFC